MSGRLRRPKLAALRPAGGLVSAARRPAGPNRRARIGHNGGPPLEPPHEPEWGRGGFSTYFAWRDAHEAAWKRVPRDTMLRRLEKAESLGLTYEEYALEILERGVFLQAEDTTRIAAIKAARPTRKSARRAAKPTATNPTAARRRRGPSSVG